MAYVPYIQAQPEELTDRIELGLVWEARVTAAHYNDTLAHAEDCAHNRGLMNSYSSASWLAESIIGRNDVFQLQESTMIPVTPGEAQAMRYWANYTRLV